MNLKSTILVLCAILIGMTDLAAQELKFPEMDKSPMDAAHYPRRAAFKNYLSEDDPDRTQKIKVLYCRPFKKDRVIFGELVPWGQDWRLGANEATEVIFFQPVEIGGTTLSAGTYTMFAQCYPDHWILKISEERFIAGTENRDITKDVVAVSIPTSQVANTRENFTIGFQKVDDSNVNMLFEWDHTRATLPINLNAPTMAGTDASPMDLVQYPNSSRFRNYQKPEDLDKAVAKVRVVYSRPQKKGRDVFGGLLKPGSMWRVGANETTELTFFEDVTIGGKEVKAGKYGLFAKVNEGNWEFIIHKNVQSWGPPNHDDKDNVVTVTAQTQKTPSTVEAMTILLQENGENKVDLIVAWDDTMAKLPIMFNGGKKS